MMMSVGEAGRAVGQREAHRPVPGWKAALQMFPKLCVGFVPIKPKLNFFLLIVADVARGFLSACATFLSSCSNVPDKDIISTHIVNSS